jgi:hypothetical protein
MKHEIQNIESDSQQAIPLHGFILIVDDDMVSRVKSNLSGGNDFIAKPIIVLELAVKALTWLYNEDLKPLALAGGESSASKG